MAITDDLALYALGRWMHESHPTRIDGLCLNKVQWKTHCDACDAACPADVAVSAEEVDWSACSNCNWCVTACPTCALNEARPSFDALEVAQRESEGRVLFACERYEGPCDVRRTCLATLPWDLLAAVALRGHATVELSPCRDCPDAEALSRVKELMRELRDFLGERLFAERVSMKAMRGSHNAGARKRQALMGIARTARIEADTLVGETPETPQMSRYRALLLDAIDQEERREREGGPLRLNWRTIVEDGDCRACGACVAMCPHHALSLHLADQDASDAVSCAGGSGQADAALHANPGSVSAAALLIHDAALCTQCGLCYISCPEATLGGWPRVAATRDEAQVTFELDVAYCEKCGRPFKPKESERRCPACSRFRFL